MVEKEKIYELIKYFRKIDERTYQLLGWLGFTKEETIKTPSGEWDLYIKKDFKFPYFYSEFNPPINKFFAILKNSKEFVIYGNFEKKEEIKNLLMEITNFFFRREKKIIGIPFSLNEENAENYGYIRGLLLGFFLIFLDFIYSWIFKLKNGIITGFIDYVKLVYYGNPPFGITIGIAGTGLYFIFLLIILPILFGIIYKKIAIKKRKNFLERISFPEYEFGIEAEKALEEEFSVIVEEKRKEKIYEEIKKDVYIEKKEFEFLYESLKNGFLKIEEMLNFLEEYNKLLKEFPLKKFLEIISKYENAKIQTDIKISD